VGGATSGRVGVARWVVVRLRWQSVSRLLLRVAGETFAMFTARHLHNKAETKKVTMEIPDSTSKYPEHINLHFSNDKGDTQRDFVISALTWNHIGNNFKWKFSFQIQIGSAFKSAASQIENFN